ncbi:MAG: cupin domain-containing protein [Parabacteroides sp.]|nr:cupin domain-containing protein [Parabacteroides sp.]
MAPVQHVNAHSAPFANAVKMGYDPAGPDWTYQYFSICEIAYGGAALNANHGPADHVFYILEGEGYSMIQGKRYTYKAGDLMWTPGNRDHEMYPDGTANLKFLVTLCPRGFKQTEAYIKNLHDAKVTEKDGVTFFTLADESLTGSGSQEFHIVDLYPGKTLSMDTPKSDVIAFMYNGKCKVTVDGESMDMTRQEDAAVIPMGTKWGIENVGKQCVRLAVSLSPCR